MRGSIISSRIRSGSSSETAARALSPSLAVITRIFSRCSVNCTILRTVGLSSTTSTTGSFINSSSFCPAPGPYADQSPFDACVDLTDEDWNRWAYSPHHEHCCAPVQAYSLAPLPAPASSVLQSLAGRFPIALGSAAQNENCLLLLAKYSCRSRALTIEVPLRLPNKRRAVAHPSPVYLMRAVPCNQGAHVQT